nr:MAG TPA: hypothetical protein [Caudoviricetes sp.]
MALLDLFSVFYSYFKNGVAVSTFTGNHHSATLCIFCEENRHFITTLRAFHPEAVLLF